MDDALRGQSILAKLIAPCCHLDAADVGEEQRAEPSTGPFKPCRDVLRGAHGGDRPCDVAIEYFRDCEALRILA